MENNVEEHPASRYRAGNGAIFSSTKCPPGPGLEQTCELPFGFLWTPLSPTDDMSTLHCDAELPPVLCLTCLSYLNLYASFDAETGQWICPLCGAKNVAPDHSLQSEGGTLASLLVPSIYEIRQSITRSEGDDSCNVIILVMDRNLPRDEAQAVGRAFQSILSESSIMDQPVKIGLIIFDKAIHIYHLSVSGLAVADVFPDHDSLTDDYLDHRPYLAQIGHGNNLDCIWRCLSAVYGVQLQDEGENLDQNGSSSRLEMLRRRKAERARKEQTLQDHTVATSPWDEARNVPSSSMRCTGEAVQCAIDLASADRQQPARTARILLFTNGCPNFGEGSVVAPESSESTSKVKADVVDPIRLARSIEYYEILSKAAAEMGIAMDVLCSGSHELALTAYQALVEGSSGYVLPHATFDSDHLKYNLGFLMNHMYVSAIRISDTGREPSKEGTLDRSWIDGCVVDFRTTSFLTATHLVGPGEVVEEGRTLLPSERSAFAKGSALAASRKIPTNMLPSADAVETTMTRVQMGRFDPISTFSVLLEVNEFFQHESHALIQCIVRYADPDGKTLVTRVCSHRMSVAKETGEWLDAVDDEVVPVLLAKEAVYRSVYGRDTSKNKETGAIDATVLEGLAYDAQRDLDATIQRISLSYRLLGLEKGTRRGMDATEEGGVKAAGSSVDFAFPPELADALRRLYHFRRGPILSPGPMQSMDDRAAIRSLFIRVPLEDCLSMMALSLWSCVVTSGYSSMTDVPPDTLALWDNAVLGGDHYYLLFVWSGKATLSKEYDTAREDVKSFLLKRSNNRFPMPTLQVMTENESMSRHFTALLAPSHGDPVDHQLTNFPALGALSPTELTALQSKFKFYDAETDASFRNWFWSVASATNSYKDEGVSLCE